MRGTPLRPDRPLVHPRLCGEHRRQGCGIVIPACAGNEEEAELEARFIPACAGNTKYHVQQAEVPGIPACAGNTRGSRRSRAPGTVHPRLCGEHSSIASMYCERFIPGGEHAGAVRGQPPGMRFIPACAGNTRVIREAAKCSTAVHPPVRGTLITRVWHADAAVHPRLCGEHFEITRHCIPVPTPVHPRLCGEHAGDPLSVAARGVHPRLCGEHAALAPDPVHPRLCGEHYSPGVWRCTVHPRLCGEH